jgi:hypothetical protein
MRGHEMRWKLNPRTTTKMNIVAVVSSTPTGSRLRLTPKRSM